MEITVGEITGNRLAISIVDGKEEYKGQVFIGDVRRPLSEFCDMKQVFPLLLLFYAKTLKTETTITDLRAKAEAVAVSMEALR
jgi:hypothetical protein